MSRQMSDGNVFTVGNSNQLAKEKGSYFKDFNSMDDPQDDPAIVVLLADDTSINQCLALPTIPILPGIIPL